jgi:hypothetical protein
VNIDSIRPPVDEADGADQKRIWRRLTVRTDLGEEFVLGLESGPPFFGFWNALLGAARSQRGRGP